MAATYTYRREGEGRELVYPGLRRREAYSLIGEHIYYNGLASKRDAQTFAATVALATPATFGPYTFTVTRDKAAR